jgi:hypothetical protein
MIRGRAARRILIVFSIVARPTRLNEPLLPWQ